MNTTVIAFQENKIIEFAFARIIEGKESQILEDYFPKVLSIAADYGSTLLCSFNISNSKSKLGKPNIGALVEWPNIEAFCELHEDPRFLAIKGIRDNALSLCTDGHFFRVTKNSELAFNNKTAYSIISTWNNKNSCYPDALAILEHEESPINTLYRPCYIAINKWDENGERILQEEQVKQTNERTEIFKFTL